MPETVTKFTQFYSHASLPNLIGRVDKKEAAWVFNRAFLTFLGGFDCYQHLVKVACYHSLYNGRWSTTPVYGDKQFNNLLKSLLSIPILLVLCLIQ